MTWFCPIVQHREQSPSGERREKDNKGNKREMTRERRTALWFRTTKNPGIGVEPLARLFFICSHRSLICLFRTVCFARSTLFAWLACSARSLRCAHSFAGSLTHSRAGGKVKVKMFQYCAVLDQSGPACPMHQKWECG